jgi:hypothetical protein
MLATAFRIFADTTSTTRPADLRRQAEYDKVELPESAVRERASLDRVLQDTTGPMMATDHIRYDVLARDALRGVLRRVLTDAAEHGLPGEHHFFITFLSTADGVKLSPRLLAQYPEEMTVILQHQFWDLAVMDDRFEVGLSFGGIPEKLVIPFSAIKSFFDPSVQFGLQFETDAMAETAEEAPAAPVASLPAPAETPQNEPAKPAEGAEVVRLDRFRKK